MTEERIPESVLNKELKEMCKRKIIIKWGTRDQERIHTDGRKNMGGN